MLKYFVKRVVRSVSSTIVTSLKLKRDQPSNKQCGRISKTIHYVPRGQNKESNQLPPTRSPTISPFCLVKEYTSQPPEILGSHLSHVFRSVCRTLSVYIVGVGPLLVLVMLVRYRGCPSTLIGSLVLPRTDNLRYTHRWVLVCPHCVKPSMSHLVLLGGLSILIRVPSFRLYCL